MTQQHAQPMTQQQRRQYNRTVHRQQRLEAAAARGPAGIAAAWMDEARAAAKSWSDPEAAWSDLAVTLQHFCRRYGR